LPRTRNVVIHGTFRQTYVCGMVASSAKAGKHPLAGLSYISDRFHFRGRVHKRCRQEAGGNTWKGQGEDGWRRPRL